MSLDCSHEEIDFQPTNASYYRRELKKAQAENAELKANLFKIGTAYDEACRLVAKMHEAAVGYIGSPKLGVVEDVAELRAKLDAWEKQPIVGWIDKEDKRRLLPETPMGEDEEFFEPLFTKPKEA